MTGDIAVRVATLADLDAIVAVHTAARSAYYRSGGLPEEEYDTPDGKESRRKACAEAITSPEKRVVCAILDGVIVGMAAMGPPPEPATEAAGQLFQIHVLPGYWGRGVGGKLHAAFVDYLRENGLTVGQLEAWEHNRRAHAFYERQGWRPIGRRTPAPRGSSYLHLRLDLGVGF